MPIIITLDCNNNIIACEGEIPEGFECDGKTSKGVACEDVRICDGKAFDSDSIAIPLSEITIRKPYANMCSNKDTYRCVGCHHNGENFSTVKWKHPFKRVIRIKTNDGQPESLYRMQLGVKHAVCSKPCNTPFWNNMSDRIAPGKSVPVFIRKSGRTGPGFTGAGGVGVDIKHGSYARYLNKLKGGIIKGGGFETTNNSGTYATFGFGTSNFGLA
jgi:hypothetical protein